MLRAHTKMDSLMRFRIVALPFFWMFFNPRLLLLFMHLCRHFILKLVAENIAFEHAIMNLPQNATDFLDVFIGLHSRLGEKR
jgi:hypothetical protein